MCILRHGIRLKPCSFKTYQCVCNSIALPLAICGHGGAFETCDHGLTRSFWPRAFDSTGHMRHAALIRFLPDGNLDFFSSPTSLCPCPDNTARTSVSPDGPGREWTCLAIERMDAFSILRFSAQSKGPGAGLSGFSPAADGDKPNDLGPVAEPISARLLHLGEGGNSRVLQS